MLKRIVGLVAGAGVAALVLGGPGAFASSHREAPFITSQPKVDGTDFYMFTSYEAQRQGFVTLVANYQPFEEAFGGPNYYPMDHDALYEIHIDNVGDAKEHLTFQFRFQEKSPGVALMVGGKSVAVPFLAVGPITAADASKANYGETYTVNVVRGDRRTGDSKAITNAADGKTVFDKPLDFVGTKTFPDYGAYAAAHTYDINVPGCTGKGRMFVGQRKDPFVINLGETFDLVNIKNPLGDPAGAKDDLADKNVTSLELELPAACLTAGNANGIIGGWTTASLRQGRVLGYGPKFGKGAAIHGGAWTQVSRLGMPLTNEVVVGLKDKDKWNSSVPADDAQFADYVTNPTLPAVLELLFGAAGVKAPTLFPRTDLVAVFLTGVPKLNANGSTAEMLRLNTTTPPLAKGAQNNLGVIGGDVAGFPNGRRPGDDVVDISLRVVMGKLLTADQAPSGQLPFTDGALVNDSFFDDKFPYLRTPVPGASQAIRLGYTNGTYGGAAGPAPTSGK